MMRPNINRIRCCKTFLRDLVEQCFTEEQKAALEYQQCKITVTIVDQLMRHYGGHYLLYEPEDVISYAAQLIHENSYLIDEIQVIKEKIKQITTPGNYKVSSSTLSNSVNCSNTDIDTTSNTRSVLLNDTTTQSVGSSYGRDISAKPDTLITGLDIVDESNKIDVPTLSASKSFKEDSITSLEVISTPKQINPVDKVSDNLKYHNTSITKSNDKGYSATSVFSDSRGESKSASESKGVSTGNTTSESSSEVVADSVLKSLTVRIPNIRSKFWNKFGVLFSVCLSC